MKKNKIINRLIFVWVFALILGIFLNGLDYIRLSYYVIRRGSLIKFSFPLEFNTTLFTSSGGVSTAETNFYAYYPFAILLIAFFVATIIILLVSKSFKDFFAAKRGKAIIISLAAITLAFLLDMIILLGMPTTELAGHAFSPVHIDLIKDGKHQIYPIFSFIISLPALITAFICSYQYAKEINA